MDDIIKPDTLTDYFTSPSPEEMQKIRDGVGRDRVRRTNIPKIFRSGFAMIDQSNEKWRKLVIAGHTMAERACNKTCKTLSWIFSGETGSGKTMLASAILVECVMRGKNVCHLNWDAFVLLAQAGFRDTEAAKETQAMIDDYSGADLATLDELGGASSGKLSEWESRQIYALISSRINKGVPTIYTTNLNVEEIRNIGGGHGKIAARILGNNTFVEI